MIAATSFSPIVRPCSGWSLERWSVQLIMFSIYEVSYYKNLLNQFNLRELLNWKHYQLYTPPLQRSAWIWPYNWGETRSYNYNL